MNSKILKIILTFIVLVLLIVSFSYWVETVYDTDNNDFLYSAVFFWLTGISFLCSFYFFFVEAKKINNIVFKLIAVIIPMSGFFWGRAFGGTPVTIENKLVGIFSKPIMWMLIATLLGHLVLD